MLKSKLDEISKLKEKATAQRNRGMHDRALSLLVQAASQLEEIRVQKDVDEFNKAVNEYNKESATA